MKLQIDTTEKAIRLLDSVPMGELVDILKKLLPDKAWREFSIQYAGEVHWKDVIYVPLTYPQPIYPWYTTSGELGTVSGAVETYLANGIYNVETTELKAT